ncbi:MAG: nuclear transport factor 2 family protein [Gaiellaceae bacterium]
MKWIAVSALVCCLGLAGCGGSGTSSAAEQKLQQQADYWAIDQIERSWHRASSTKDVDLMMSLWASDATFNVGTQTLQGKAQIRDFFSTTATPFQPENNWVSETPAYKIKITVSGDRGTIYFDCIYVDRKTGKVASVVGADQNVQKIDGKWLITSAAGATPTL